MKRNLDQGFERAGLMLGEVKPTGEPYRPEAWIPVATAAEKPSRSFVKEQARKLGGKPFAPSDKGLIAVVIDAFLQYCQSEAHVERCVEKILTEIPRWPDVTDIRQIALDTREIETRANPDCEKCGGCGFAATRKIIDGVPYDFSRRCDCWRAVKVGA
jgi:hypothetical protein